MSAVVIAAVPLFAGSASASDWHGTPPSYLIAVSYNVYSAPINTSYPTTLWNGYTNADGSRQECHFTYMYGNIYGQAFVKVTLDGGYCDTSFSTSGITGDWVWSSSGGIASAGPFQTFHHTYQASVAGNVSQARFNMCMRTPVGSSNYTCATVTLYPFG